MGGGPARRIVSELKSVHDVLRTTKEDLDVVVSGWEVGRNLILRHKSDTTSPPGWGVIQNKVNLESRGVFVGKLIEFLLEEDIFVVDISINQAQLGAVLGVFERSADDLKHWGDAGTPSNHANFT
jgi:hypothetical protein